MPEIIDIHPNSPTQQPSSPRTHWTKEVKAFQCAEFAMLDEDEPQPPDEVVREIAEDMLSDYYSDDKIVFE